jgi:hypothetical protein
MRFSPSSSNAHDHRSFRRLRLFIFQTLESNEAPFNLLSQFPLGLALTPIGRSSIYHLRGIQTEGAGTIRSNPGIHFEDARGLSSDNDDSDEETDLVTLSIPPPLLPPLLNPFLISISHPPLVQLLLPRQLQPTQDPRSDFQNSQFNPLHLLRRPQEVTSLHPCR